MTSNILNFEKKIGIKFKDKNLVKFLLTHKSTDKKNNNEKLEFLGDRVIGLILSKKLFELYPTEPEGVLDKKFANLVNKKTCSRIGWSIGLQNYIIIGNKSKKINQTDEKILSDACEALIGAIFIEKGFVLTENFVLKIWKQEIVKSKITILDSKTKLQEYSLKKYKKLPIYRLVSSTGPKHNPSYKISVKIIGSKEYFGLGSSKQQAEQDAASIILSAKGIN
jgi:ribonuclease III